MNPSWVDAVTAAGRLDVLPPTTALNALYKFERMDAAQLSSECLVLSCFWGSAAARESPG